MMIEIYVNHQIIRDEFIFLLITKIKEALNQSNYMPDQQLSDIKSLRLKFNKRNDNNHLVIDLTMNNSYNHYIELDLPRGHFDYALIKRDLLIWSLSL